MIDPLLASLNDLAVVVVEVRMSRADLRILFTAAAAFFVSCEMATAQPPPPGWEEAYRARVCATAPPATPADLHSTSLTEATAGVARPKVALAEFAWAAEISGGDVGHPLGLTWTSREGIVVATDRGLWVRLPHPETGPAGLAAAESYPVAGDLKPSRLTGASGQIFFAIVGQGDTVASFDLGACGFGAKADPSFRLLAGRANIVGLVSPSLGGLSQSQIILVQGNGPRGPAQLAAGPRSHAPRLPWGEPFLSPKDGEAIDAFDGFDIDGGCDAVAAVRRRDGVTELRTFCSPQFKDHTTMIAGDVAFPVGRSLNGVTTPQLLATFRDRVVGLAWAWMSGGREALFVLTEPKTGLFRIICLTGKSVTYR